MQVFHIVPEPGGECCDFCTARPVFKTYATISCGTSKSCSPMNQSGRGRLVRNALN